MTRSRWAVFAGVVVLALGALVVALRGDAERRDGAGPVAPVGAAPIEGAAGGAAASDLLETPPSGSDLAPPHPESLAGTRVEVDVDGVAATSADADSAPSAADAWLVGRVTAVDRDATGYARLWIGPVGGFRPWDEAFRWNGPRTNEEGRFVLGWSEELAATDVLELALVHRSDEYFARIETPRTRRRHDLGEIRLARAPLLVRGRLVDARGRSLGLARVELLARGTPRVLASARTKSDGRFVFRLRPGPAGVWLRAARPGYAEAEHAYIDVPDAGEIVLWREFGLRGRVLVDPALADAGLRVAARPIEGAEARRPGERVVELGPTGAFELRHLRPGRYEMVLTASQWLGPELEMAPSIEIQSERSSIDLGVLDATARLLRTSVTLRASDGSPIAAGELRFAGDDAPRTSSVSLEPVGHPEFGRMKQAGFGAMRIEATSHTGAVLHLAPSLDVAVGARGVQTRGLRLTGGEMDVELVPGPRVELTLTGITPTPGIFAVLARDGSNGPTFMVDASAETVSFALDAPGRWWVRLDDWHRGAFAPRDPAAQGSVPIDVESRAGVQRFEIPVDPAVAARLEAMLRFAAGETFEEPPPPAKD